MRNEEIALYWICSLVFVGMSVGFAANAATNWSWVDDCNDIGFHRVDTAKGKFAYECKKFKDIGQ